MSFWKILVSLGLISSPATAADLKKAHEEFKNGKAIIIDVREKSEIASGMVAGAIWLPMSGIHSTATQEQIQELPKDKELYIYCAVGGRAGKVVKMLSRKGITAENVGGFKDLKAAGFPTVLGK